MSMHVASHIRMQPLVQGVMVTPAGRFPSDLERPDGSSRDGILADGRDRWMMLLIAACVKCLPVLLLLILLYFY